MRVKEIDMSWTINISTVRVANTNRPSANLDLLLLLYRSSSIISCLDIGSSIPSCALFPRVDVRRVARDVFPFPCILDLLIMRVEQPLARDLLRGY
jgi:hypothetical protein